jgi:putative radical SAM enzyme (TIGR03279 family)
MGRAEAGNEFTYAGQIAAVIPGGLAAELGWQAGDELLSINGHPLRDVIDVQFYSADEYLELLLRRDGELTLYEVERDYAQPLGIEFNHPTFDAQVYRCDNLCEFCFVLQMPPGMRYTLYVKDDDYRYSFLQGQYVTLTNLRASDWARIQEQHLSPLYVSVHATDPALRRRLLRNPEIPDVMEQLRRLGSYGIQVHTQIVVTPGLNDGPQLERSITDLASLWPSVCSVSVVPVGITRYHKRGLRPNTRAEAAAVVEQVGAHQKTFLAQLGVRFAYLTDEWYLTLEKPVPPLAAYDDLELQENGLGLVRAFLDEWQDLKVDIRYWGLRRERSVERLERVTLVTGTLFAPTLAKVAREFGELSGIEAQVVPVVNHALGESVTVAGLLMGQDIIEQLQARALGDLVILPRVAFEHPDGISLDDVSPGQIAQAIDRPVTLADGMNDLLNAARV